MGISRLPQAPIPLNAEWAIDSDGAKRAAHLFGPPIDGRQRTLCGAAVTRSFYLQAVPSGAVRCETCSTLEARRAALLQRAAHARELETAR